MSPIESFFYQNLKNIDIRLIKLIGCIVIKIYSINEIIDATNAILSNSSIEKKKIKKQSTSGKIKNIVLDVNSTNMQNKINQYPEVSIFEKEETHKDLNVTKEELIEKMYLFFSKKIKKNTLKLIIELNEEIIFLTKNISFQKENNKKQKLDIQLLKKNTLDLKSIESALTNELNETIINFNILKTEKENSDSNNELLNEKNNNLILNYNAENKILLTEHENRELSLKSKIEKLEKQIIINNKLLDETNNKNDILENSNNEINTQLIDYKNNEEVLKSKIETLEKEILVKNNLLNHFNVDENKIELQIVEIDDYKKQIKEFKEKNENLQNTIYSLKSVSNNNQEKFISDLESKIKHYQNENIRVSSELVESDRRFTVTKESLSMLQNQRSDLIDKLNSINQAIKGENIVSNVFNEGMRKNDDVYIPEVKSSNKIEINKRISEIFKNR